MIDSFIISFVSSALGHVQLANIIRVWIPIFNAWHLILSADVEPNAVFLHVSTSNEKQEYRHKAGRIILLTNNAT
jgi:hypothetical protein